jgi:hypothetical protein
MDVFGTVSKMMGGGDAEHGGSLGREVSAASSRSSRGPGWATR